MCLPLPPRVSLHACLFVTTLIDRFLSNGEFTDQDFHSTLPATWVPARGKCMMLSSVSSPHLLLTSCATPYKWQDPLLWHTPSPLWAVTFIQTFPISPPRCSWPVLYLLSANVFAFYRVFQASLSLPKVVCFWENGDKMTWNPQNTFINPLCLSSPISKNNMTDWPSGLWAQIHWYPKLHHLRNNNVLSMSSWILERYLTGHGPGFHHLMSIGPWQAFGPCPRYWCLGFYLLFVCLLLPQSPCV